MNYILLFFDFKLSLKSNPSSGASGPLHPPKFIFDPNHVNSTEGNQLNSISISSQIYSSIPNLPKVMEDLSQSEKDLLDDLNKESFSKTVDSSSEVIKNVNNVSNSNVVDDDDGKMEAASSSKRDRSYLDEDSDSESIFASRRKTLQKSDSCSVNLGSVGGISSGVIPSRQQDTEQQQLQEIQHQVFLQQQQIEQHSSAESGLPSTDAFPVKDKSTQQDKDKERERDFVQL